MSSRVRLACVLAAAIGLAAPASAQLQVREIGLSTADLAHDPVTGRIYASVPGSAGFDGNSVTWIDPASLALGPFVFVGSEPGKLAPSDDGQFLYVALDGAAAVRRFHVPTGTAEIQFGLGSTSFTGPHFVEDMAVQPGNPGVLAVSLKYLNVSPRHAGVAIFEDGVKRPTMTPGHTGSNVIEFSSSPGRLYGYNNNSTEFGFRRMDVTAAGVQVVSVTPTAISGGFTDIHFHQGWVTATTGATIDPETGTTLGTYAGIPFSFSGSVATHPARDEITFLADDKLRTYRRSTFVFLQELTVPNVQGETSSLVAWGTDGLAFRTSANQVFLLSEAPLRHVRILPASGTYLDSQDFDLALLVETQDTPLAGIAGATVDGIDVTQLLRSTAIPGSAGPLGASQRTLRCPGFGAEVARLFGAGTHTIEVSLSLEEGSDLSATAVWTMLPTAERSIRNVRAR